MMYDYELNLNVGPHWLACVSSQYVYKCEFGTNKDVRFIRKDQLKDFRKKEGILISDLRMEGIL